MKEFFAENGYWLEKGVYGLDQLQKLEQDFDRIVTQISASDENVNARWGGKAMDQLDAGQSVVIHTHNVQQYSAEWLHAFRNEKFLNIAEAILGPNIILHHSKLFLKPPEKGSPFPMHQDWAYFPSENDSMIAAIIHVTEATDEMGCLRVYPGSHKLGRIPDSYGTLENEMLERYPLEDATVLEAEPGDALFFHYFTIHGSMPNRSPKARKTVLVQLHSGDDQIEQGNEHPNERLALRGFNSRLTRGVANKTK